MALSYPEAIQWFYSFARFDSNAPRLPDNLKLARMQEILAQLGNPHEQFPSVLIAGTKGKGSTAALLESILHAAGYRTGLFTSPHLHTFRERIRINGELIPKIHVVQGTTLLQSFASNYSTATFFEWVTALAFDYFARQRVEIAIVEVGLGGRLDCTNVLEPRVSVITPISFDHMDILGDTLEKIAYEKAGIIKPETPVVVAPQPPEAMQVILGTARSLNAPVIEAAAAHNLEHAGSNVAGQVIRELGNQGTPDHLYMLPLAGPHQRVNAATAIAAVETLHAQGWRLPQVAIKQGIERVKWHARFEILAQSTPMPSGVIVPGNAYVVADGAHNRASAHELKRTLEEVFPGARVHYIFAAASDKDIHGMFEELLPGAASLVLTQSHHSRATPPETLARMAAPFIYSIQSASSLLEAMMLSRQLAVTNDVICVTGSLYIAAEARELILSEQGVRLETDV
jgi:dihydrofolate synthase/folylpolyglutamate synthase